MPGENFRVDEAELAGGEIAGQSSQGAGQHEGAELVTEYRVADGTHTLFVGSDACQRASERCTAQLIQKGVYDEHEHQDQIIKLHRVFVTERLAAAHSELGSEFHVHAVRTHPLLAFV